MHPIVSERFHTDHIGEMRGNVKASFSPMQVPTERLLLHEVMCVASSEAKAEDAYRYFLNSGCCQKAQRAVHTAQHASGEQLGTSPARQLGLKQRTTLGPGPLHEEGALSHCSTAKPVALWATTLWRSTLTFSGPRNLHRWCSGRRTRALPDPPFHRRFNGNPFH